MSDFGLPAFMMSVSASTAEALLAEWKWLVPASATPLFITIFGDWVFGEPDGGIAVLSILEGSYDRVAASAAGFNSLKLQPEWLDSVFIASWQEIAHRAGLVPASNQCLGWRLHPLLGGRFEVQNLQVFDMLVYQCLMGQLHRRIAHNPSA